MRAVVTGAGRGLGLELARQLAGRGYRVIGTARKPSKYEALLALCEAGGVETRALDVGSPESIADLAASLSEPIDLLVSCAGVNAMSNVPHSKESSLRLGVLEQDSLLSQFRVNAVGPTLLVQALLPRLEAAEAARVLHISSWLGSIAIKEGGGNYGYAASKAALNMMNRALAGDLRERGIISVAMNPGWVRTDMGGQKAKLSPEESVNGMLDTLFSLTLEDSGGFYQWDGSTHPW